jgi:transposase
MKTGLSYVASAVGRLLHTNKLTTIKKRISYVRVSVEVEA